MTGRLAFEPAPLYPIIDLSPGEATPAFALADQLLSAGVPWLQLRAKATAPRDLLPVAVELVRRARRRAARVIVNDRVDVAIAADAAGVHLGQDDLPLAAALPVARAHRLIVGISTHDAEQARAAARGGADYVGFGPMFATPTKPDALPPRHTGALEVIRSAVSIPIVAIGGITEENAQAVLRAGADAVAMIGALAATPDARALARRLLQRAPSSPSGDDQSS